MPSRGAKAHRSRWGRSPSSGVRFDGYGYPATFGASAAILPAAAAFAVGAARAKG